MNREFFSTIPAIVVNPASGNGTMPGRIYAEMASRLPFRHTRFEFRNIIDNPSLLRQPIVIGIGGDGTQGTIARLMYIHNPGGRQFMVDGGTVGIDSESTGLGRKPGESAERYARRIIRMIRKIPLVEDSVPPGTYGTTTGPADDGKIFFSDIGMGDASSAGFIAIQLNRNHAGKINRAIRFTEALYHTLKSANEFEVSHGNRTTVVLEAHILKHPFKNLQYFSLPYPGQDILVTIPKRTRREIIKRLAIDTVFIALGFLPPAHGLEIEPIPLGDTVLFQSERHDTGRIDAEVAPLSTPLYVRARDTSRHGFKIIRKAD